MAVEIEGSGDDLIEAGCKRVDFRDLVDAALQDGKFIAAQSRKNITFTQTTTHALADLSKQLVTEGMTQGVIHALETIEIKTQNREFLIPFRVRKAIFQLLLESTAGSAGLSARHGAPYARFLPAPPGVP